MARQISKTMWENQTPFQVALKNQISFLFTNIKSGLNPDAFVVGVVLESARDELPVRLEPASDHWTCSADFSDLLDAAKARKASYPEFSERLTEPLGQQIEEERLFRRAVRETVLERLQASSCFPSDARLFASQPVERGDLLVMSFITVDRRTFDALPGIEDSTIWIDEDHSFEVASNFVEAVIEQVLKQANELITHPKAGAS